MAEYIKRETLLKAVEKIDRLDKETNTNYEYNKEGYILLIQNAPTADVVEIPCRCEQCKHHIATSDIQVYYCKERSLYTDKQGFCHCGERE